MKIDFPNHPETGQVFHAWVWDGEKWISHASSGWAPIWSPDFKGMPTAPTPEPGSNDAKIATTAFVAQAIEHHIAGVASWNGRTGHVELELSDIFEAGGAPLHSPHFTGQPEADTPPLGDDTRRLATTEFVRRAFDVIRDDSVWSFNNRRGDVTLTTFDIVEAGGAPLSDPLFTGLARAPTPPMGNDSNRIATTAFVGRAIEDLEGDIDDELREIRENSVLTWNQRKGHVVMRWSDVSAVGGAPVESPFFTGIPRGPTAPPQTDSNQLATTRYVDAAIRSNPGPPGPQGPQGEMGRGLNFRGTVENVSELPTSGRQIGDTWIAENTGVAYYWNGSNWIPLGDLRGPPGTANAHVGPAPPFLAQEGALWFDSDNRTLYVREEGEWRRNDRLFNGDDAGLVPASEGWQNRFLRADGEWANPVPSIPDLTVLGNTTGIPGNAVAYAVPISNIWDNILLRYTPGGTTNFLRADGAWAAPPERSIPGFSVPLNSSSSSGPPNAAITFPLDNGLFLDGSGDFKLIPLFTNTQQGSVPPPNWPYSSRKYLSNLGSWDWKENFQIKSDGGTSVDIGTETTVILLVVAWPAGPADAFLPGPNDVAPGRRILVLAPIGDWSVRYGEGIRLEDDSVVYSVSVGQGSAEFVSVSGQWRVLSKGALPVPAATAAQIRNNTPGLSIETDPAWDAVAPVGFARTGNVTLNLNNGINFQANSPYTLTGNITFSFSNAKEGQAGIIALMAGNFDVFWNVAVELPPVIAYPNLTGWTLYFYYVLGDGTVSVNKVL
jgi:hypothetical protein